MKGDGETQCLFCLVEGSDVRENMLQTSMEGKECLMVLDDRRLWYCGKEVFYDIMAFGA